MQEQTLNFYRKQKLYIRVFFGKDFFVEGRITGFDKDTILLDSEEREKQYLIYKNSVLYIEKAKKEFLEK